MIVRCLLEFLNELIYFASPNNIISHGNTLAVIKMQVVRLLFSERQAGCMVYQTFLANLTDKNCVTHVTYCKTTHVQTASQLTRRQTAHSKTKEILYINCTV